MGSERNWTKEEEQYLEEHWGEVSIEGIAKHLGREPGGVINKKSRMGLGAFLMNGDYIVKNQLLKTLRGTSSGSYYNKNHVFSTIPYKKKRVLNNFFSVIRLDDFWRWAEENKRAIDFSKLEEGALGQEPEWVKRKRKIDFECRVNTNPWTQAEDQKLLRMAGKFQYTYTEIAAELNRTENAVKRRLLDLGSKLRPLKADVKPWNREEIVQLVFMHEEGYSFEKIGNQLGRSALSCRGKIERIENPNYFKRENRRAREQIKEAERWQNTMIC